MTLTSRPLALIIFIMLFGGIALSSALGAWQTRGSRFNMNSPTAGQSGNGASRESGSDQHLIQGKTTFQDLLDWGMSQAVIEQIIGAPLPVTSLTVKDYCMGHGLSFGTLKAALQVELDKIAP